MQVDELKPCPLCGGTNVYIRGEASGWSVVHTCQDMEGVSLSTSKHRRRYDAINEWNTMDGEVVTKEERKQRVHDIVYSCDSRDELAERIVRLEDENAELSLLAKGLIWCDSSKYNKGACDSCPINHNRNPRIGRCEHMAKKLGIEVGE